MQIVAKAKKLPGMTGEKKDKKEKEQAGDGPPGSGLRFFFLWSFFALFFSLSPWPPSPRPPYRGVALQACVIGILGALGFSHSLTPAVYTKGFVSIYIHVYTLFLTRAALGLLTFTCMRCSIDVCTVLPTSWSSGCSQCSREQSVGRCRAQMTRGSRYSMYLLCQALLVQKYKY
jgi:hypothetical protein